jgi:hypothetical protein
MLLVEELVMERRSTFSSFLTLKIHMPAISNMIENNAKADRQEMLDEKSRLSDREGASFHCRHAQQTRDIDRDAQAEGQYVA